MELIGSGYKAELLWGGFIHFTMQDWVFKGDKLLKEFPTSRTGDHLCMNCMYQLCFCVLSSGDIVPHGRHIEEKYKVSIITIYRIDGLLSYKPDPYVRDDKMVTHEHYIGIMPSKRTLLRDGGHSHEVDVFKNPSDLPEFWRSVFFLTHERKEGVIKKPEE